MRRTKKIRLVFTVNNKNEEIPYHFVIAVSNDPPSKFDKTISNGPEGVLSIFEGEGGGSSPRACKGPQKQNNRYPLQMLAVIVQY